MFAIAGATGTVGKALTRNLLDAGAHVRVVTRDKAKARALWPDDTLEIAQVDFDDPRSLEKAFAGTNQAFLATGTGPRQVRDEKALIDAAIRGGTGHLVALSVHPAPGVRNPVNDLHDEIDGYLAGQSVPATWLRPVTFIRALLPAGFIRSGTWGGAAGSGQTAPIDTRDVAAAASAVLLEGPGRHAGRSYDLTGPAALTMPELAALLSERLGKTVHYALRTEAEQRAFLTAAKLPALTVEVLLAIDELTRRNALAKTTPGVFELTGHQPRPAGTWLDDNLSLFR
jgi:NAD(P)H dehydrogenase (quinone)